MELPFGTFYFAFILQCYIKKGGCGMAVTILDVAREAGVSKSTVSLVINNSDRVKLETQYKVREAIKKLGYTPNIAARELTTNRTHTLGLIFLTSNINQKPYAFTSICETLLYDTSNGIYAGLADSQYSLLVERFSVTENSMPELIKNRRLDGVFLIGGLFTNHFIETLQKMKIPFVIIGRQYEGFDSISVDTEEVGYMGAKYLLEQGHKKIAFINGPITSSNSLKKVDGIQRALRDLDADPKSVEIIYSDSYSGLSGYNALQALWEQGLRPDAVFGGSDGLTSGASRFLYERALRIPDDISVLGYEDSILAEYATPALTVIDAHKEDLGKEASFVLINRIKKPRAKAVSLTIKPSLIIRDSVRSR
jgi:LacI family transcriptional regulator/LacI family purine nucleotide synthesis repressor